MTTQSRKAPFPIAIIAAMAGIAAPHVTEAANVAEGDPKISTSGPMSAVVGIDPDQLTCFIGGSVDGEFLSASDLAPRLRDGQSYRLFDLSGETGKTIGIGRPRPEGGSGECVDLWRQDLALKPPAKGEEAKLSTAVHLPLSATSPLPDPLELMDEPLAAHVELLRGFLSRRDIPEPEPNIIQSIRTDLEGDGTIDYILNAVRVGKEHAETGDHSIIMVVRGEGRAQRTFIIQEEVDISENPYSSTLWVNKIIAVVDIDGDGTAEIITEGGYIYGGGWEVIRWDGNGFEHRLFCGCDG
ncbi:MAG: hypothetical protein HKN60_06715 [Rhizobiales bacterium]|nr:hypothetical protein [Hyphomicrobiales bacterium]